MDITNLEALVAATPAGIPTDKPVGMLNLIRFRPTTTYPPSAGLPQVSGREAYMGGYIPAFIGIAAKIALTLPEAVRAEYPNGFTQHYIGVGHKTLVGPTGEEQYWDVVALIKYPDIETFRKIVGDPEYKEKARAHRDASIEDWRLVVSTELQ